MRKWMRQVMGDAGGGVRVLSCGHLIHNVAADNPRRFLACEVCQRLPETPQQEIERVRESAGRTIGALRAEIDQLRLERDQWRHCRKCGHVEIGP